MPTLLLVDDDKHTRALLERIFLQDPRLARHRLRVVGAVDGEDGIKLLDAERPAVVVTDLLMPRMDGFRFCRALRDREAGREVALFVVSGVYRDASVGARVRDEFAGSFFAKPTQIRELVAALDRALERAAATAGGEATPTVAHPVQGATPSGGPPAPGARPPRGATSPGGGPPAKGARPARGATTPGLAPATTERAARAATTPGVLPAGVAHPAPPAAASPPGAPRAVSHPAAPAAASRPSTSTPASPVRSVPAAGPAPAPASPPPAAPTLPGREGMLARVPLPRLLLDLHDEKATGILDLRRGRVEKRIELVLGLPVAVSSNQRQELLGQFLVARGVLTEAQLGRAIERAHNQGEKLGEALLELGLLGSGELVRYLTAQARFKLTASLRWLDGVWRFRPDVALLERAAGSALDPVAVVLLGLRRTCDLDRAARTLAPLATGPLALSERGARLRAAIAKVFGDPLVEALAAGAGLDDLCQRLDPALVTQALETLFLAGCVAGGPPPVDDANGFDNPTPLPGAPPPWNDATPVPGPLATLYDQLFGDEATGVAPPARLVRAVTAGERDDGVPDAPLPALDSSLIELGVADPAPSPPDTPDAAAARETLLTEYLRVQGQDWYEVLGLPRDARSAAVTAAYVRRMEAFALERYAAHDLGPDRDKLTELRDAYRRAYEVLGDPPRRAAYDRQLAAAATAAPPTGRAAMGSEILFREGERRLAAGDVGGAVEAFAEAQRTCPDVADYHAALGWALHLRASAARRSDPASDAHLAQALAIDPDHAPAHDYLGRVHATRGDDELAADHLERALDGTPIRGGALDAWMAVRRRRGELGALERGLRRLIHRVGTGDPALSLRLWRELAVTYRDLGDLEAARTAARCALRHDPGDPALVALADPAPKGLEARGAALRARWRRDPSDARAGRELLRAALEDGAHDAAFLAASALVARGQQDDEAAAHHRRWQPRFLARAGRALDAELWARLRHGDDDPDLEALFALLEPAATAVAPLALADLRVTPGDMIPDSGLPAPFAQVRNYVTGLLGVPRAFVFRRADFGDQVHVGALPEPILLAGPGALACEDKLRLGFHLARAGTFLLPGRTVGGSRPSRTLKELFLGAVTATTPDTAVEDPAGRVAAARAVIAGRPAAEQARLRELVGRLTQRPSVNLSRWARGLARTADRVGLLVCGDLTLAARVADELGLDDAADDLIDHALGPDHLAARVAIGVSIAV